MLITLPADILRYLFKYLNTVDVYQLILTHRTFTKLYFYSDRFKTRSYIGSIIEFGYDRLLLRYNPKYIIRNHVKDIACAKHIAITLMFKNLLKNDDKYIKLVISSHNDDAFNLHHKYWFKNKNILIVGLVQLTMDQLIIYFGSPEMFRRGLEYDIFKDWPVDRLIELLLWLNKIYLKLYLKKYPKAWVYVFQNKNKLIQKLNRDPAGWPKRLREMNDIPKITQQLQETIEFIRSLQ